MIGKCPHCKIELEKPPFGRRITNEVMLTLWYRKIIEQNKKLPPINEIGKCKLCNASKKDLEQQRKQNSPPPSIIQ
jgi:hypothetical protein